MTDEPLPAGSDDATTLDDSRPPAPRWVKVTGIVAAVVILAFVVLMLTGGPGAHGPGRHGGGGGESRTAPSGVTGHTPPEGGHAPR